MRKKGFDNLGLDVSIFGFGVMRMPMKNLERGPFSCDIDKEECVKMLRYAIDNGVNYIDTAYVYHEGASEEIVGVALKDGYREKVSLATKLPSWLIQEEKDMYRLLDEQLKRLQTDHIDFYLLHSLNSAYWQTYKKIDYKKFLEKSMKDGKIRFPSFSFHDSFDVFEEIIKSYDWKMCQIQMNYMDVGYQAGLKGLKLAESLGVRTVIMEPLKGGQLAKNIPAVQEIWEKEGVEYNPVKNAFRFVSSLPNVGVILSGVHSMEQLKENIEIFNNMDTRALSEKEISLYDKSRESLKKRIKIGCTSCSYCMPCPSGVNIPGIFTCYNNAEIFDVHSAYAEEYERMYIKKSEDASLCIECGKCENVCPQHLQIINGLKEAHEKLITYI